MVVLLVNIEILGGRVFWGLNTGEFSMVCLDFRGTFRRRRGVKIEVVGSWE